jgi:hypothetical protein
MVISSTIEPLMALICWTLCYVLMQIELLQIDRFAWFILLALFYWVDGFARFAWRLVFLGLV